MPRILPPHSKLVYPFDFQLPHQLPRAAQDAMNSIAIAWARLAGSSLTPRIALPNTILFDHAEQQTFAEVLSAWSDPYVFVPYSGTLPGVVACEVPLARLVTYRLMGGSEEMNWQRGQMLTNFEQQLWLRQIAQIFHNGLSQMWDPVIHLEQVWDTVYFEPAFLSTRIQDADWVFAAHFTWTIGNLTGRLMWVWALSDLAPLASLLAAHIHPQQGTRHRPRDPEVGWAERVRTLEVPVSVELGSVPLRLTELLQLAVGQTLVLRTRVTDTLPVRVASIVKAQGGPCAIDGHYAVQIASVLPSESDIGSASTPAESGIEEALSDVS